MLNASKLRDFELIFLAVFLLLNPKIRKIMDAVNAVNIAGKWVVNGFGVTSPI